jgi:hypothetical protein
MNYISLVALILGLISIFITIKYVDSYDKLASKIAKPNSSSTKYRYPQELLDIQDELNLSDSDFKKIIVDKKSQIIEILKKEEFVNFNVYLNSYQRRIPRNELSNLFKEAKKDLNKPIFSYKDEINLANQSINKQPMLNKNLGYKVNFTNDKPLCLNQYGGKYYNRYVNEEFECDGKIVKNLVCN